MLPLLVVPPATAEPLQPPPALVAFLVGQRHLGVSWALDGGCLSPASTPLTFRTAWAISSTDGSMRCGDTLCSPDQTAPRAERMGVWYATAAAAAAGIDVALLIDSQATVRRLTRAISYSPTGDAEVFWHAVLDRWRPGSLVAWVPSHGKDSAWAPPAHFPDAATCRYANSLADAEVTRLLDSLAPAVQSTAADAAAATIGSSNATNAARCDGSFLRALQERLAH